MFSLSNGHSEPFNVMLSEAKHLRVNSAPAQHPPDNAADQTRTLAENGGSLPRRQAGAGLSGGKNLKS